MKKLFICLFAILRSFCHPVLFFIPAPFFAISAIFLSHFWLFFSFPPSFLSFPRKPSHYHPRKHTQCHPWSTLTVIPNLIGDPVFTSFSLFLPTQTVIHNNCHPRKHTHCHPRNFYRGSSNLSSPNWLGIQCLLLFFLLTEVINTSWIPAIASNDRRCHPRNLLSRIHSSLFLM